MSPLDLCHKTASLGGLNYEFHEVMENHVGYVAQRHGGCTLAPGQMLLTFFTFTRVCNYRASLEPVFDASAQQ